VPEIPLWEIALPVFHAEIHPTGNGKGEMRLAEPAGTGFVVAPGVFVTCWHCVRPRTDGRQYIAVSLRDGATGFNLLTNITPDPGGMDLATASINYESRHPLTANPTPNVVGTEVWSVGYPLLDFPFRPRESGVGTRKPASCEGMSLGSSPIRTMHLLDLSKHTNSTCGRRTE
jgi:hypothetical protein